MRLLKLFRPHAHGLKLYRVYVLFPFFLGATHV